MNILNMVCFPQLFFQKLTRLLVHTKGKYEELNIYK